MFVLCFVFFDSFFVFVFVFVFSFFLYFLIMGGNNKPTTKKQFSRGEKTYIEVSGLTGVGKSSLTLRFVLVCCCCWWWWWWWWWCCCCYWWWEYLISSFLIRMNFQIIMIPQLKIGECWWWWWWWYGGDGVGVGVCVGVGVVLWFSYLF